MSSLPPPPPVAKGKDNDEEVVAAAQGPSEKDNSDNAPHLKRSHDDVAAAAAEEHRPQKRLARSSSESTATGTAPNAIPTFENQNVQTSSTNTSKDDNDNDGGPSPPLLPPNEQPEQQQQQQQQQHQDQQQDTVDTATLASSITYYVLCDGGEENGAIATTNVASLGQQEQQQEQEPSHHPAQADKKALPANTVVRMRIDGKTLDLRVGDVVLLSGGGDSSEDDDDISLADENAPPRDATQTAATAVTATTRSEAASNLLWTARIEGFTGTATAASGEGEKDGLDPRFDENDEISFTARWFLTPTDIESLPAGIPLVGPVSREALCSQKAAASTTAPTEVILSSKTDDNDIACIRGRATMKYNPTDEELANLADQQEENHVFFCRYHLDVSDVNFSSYRLSHYDAQLHGPGTATAVPAAATATAVDTFTLDNTMGSLSAQDQQRQQKQQQPAQGQQQQQQQQQGDDNDDDDDDDDSSSDSDNDDSTDGGERRVVVEGEGSQLRESIAVGMMHQAVVGPYIPGQLHARSRNPTLVWKASRHYSSSNNTASAAAAAADSDNNDSKDAAEAATQKFQDFLDRLAKIHTPFLTQHRLTTTDPYSPLPFHKAEALQRRRKQPMLTGSFLSTSSMLNVKKKNIDNNTKSSTSAIAIAAAKEDKSHDDVVVANELGEEQKDSEIASSPPTATEKDTTPGDGEKDAEMIDVEQPKSAASHEQPVVDMEIDNTAETKKDNGDVDDNVEPMSVDEKEDDVKVEAKKDGDDDKVPDDKMHVEKQDQDDKVLAIDDPKNKSEEASDDDGPVLECDLRKECVAEAILELWTESGENIDAAVAAVEKDLASGEGRFTTGWTMDEKKIFDDGFRETQGELRLIAKRLAPRKTLKDVVDYHYRFKIPDQFRKYQDKKRELPLRMMDCIEKRRFYDPTEDLNGGGGGTMSRRGSVTGGGDKQQQGWEETTAADVTGATEERRQKARDLLLDVQSKLGNEIMAEVMNAVRKLNRSYDGETRNSLFHLLRGHQELQKRFSEFLPRHF